MLMSCNYTANCGYGDLFMVLSDMERLGNINLVLLEHYSCVGIPELLNLLLPKVNLKFRKNYIPFKNLVDIHRTHTSRINCLDKLPLSDTAIAKIKPFQSEEDYIVIHPQSLGKERHFHKWDQIELTGINHKLVGAYDDPNLIPGKIHFLSFLKTCELLLGSCGLFGVDSCVMHLANALRVPSLIIYENKNSSIITPNYGERVFLDTSPEVISLKVKELFSGAYANYPEKKKSKKEVIKTCIDSKENNHQFPLMDEKR